MSSVNLSIALNCHPYLLIILWTQTQFPKSDGTSGSISKEATIGLERCDLPCSLGNPNLKVFPITYCQNMCKRWQMIGLLPVYNFIYVSGTTKEQK